MIFHVCSLASRLACYIHQHIRKTNKQDKASWKILVELNLGEFIHFFRDSVLN